MLKCSYKYQFNMVTYGESIKGLRRKIVLDNERDFEEKERKVLFLCSKLADFSQDSDSYAEVHSEIISLCSEIFQEDNKNIIGLSILSRIKAFGEVWGKESGLYKREEAIDYSEKLIKFHPDELETWKVRKYVTEHLKLYGEEFEAEERIKEVRKRKIDKNGYERGELNQSDLIHRQIAYKEIYIKNKKDYPLPFSKYVVHHIDRDKLNNDVSNLQILTPEEHNFIHSK
jgi:hypothetical protein